MGTVTQPQVVAVDVPHIEWSAVFAGAVVAAGVSVTLLAFGSGIGLSVASTAPTWRDSSSLLWILSGIYLVFVALCAFGLGGYVAGRMRLRLATAEASEAGFRDSMHGVISWGLAVLLTALLAIAGAATLMTAASAGTGRTGTATSVEGENTIATELDTLFRTDRLPANTDALHYRRAEAARILLKSSGHSGVSADDRDYLATIVSSQAGLSPDETQARVNKAITDSQTALHNARQAAVLQAFLVAAALLLGAAIAAAAAYEGGRDRERGAIPRFNWSFR